LTMSDDVSYLYSSFEQIFELMANWPGPGDPGPR
jgi:hypothetical protein